MNDLAIKAKNDQDALLLLWQGCSSYVYKVAMKYQNAAALNGAVDMDDLRQCAFLGFYEAVQGFEPLRGDFLVLLSYGVRRECRAILGMRGRERKEHYSTVSMETPIPGADDLTLADTLEDESASTPFELAEIRRDIDKALHRLPADMAAVIRLHDLNGLTLAQAADQHGCTFDTARKLRRHGFARLRANRSLREYIPFRHKTLAAFKTDHTSVVEDIVIRRLDNKITG